MALRLQARWLWDFWFAEAGEDVHVFYLQAPRALEDPDLRHRHATIGHAVSRDLTRWEVLGDALGPGAPGAFDDLATWTGSVVEDADDGWHLFYTGVSRAEDGAVQRIGRATSADLLDWHRRPEPALEADGEWYERADWRDPWVFRDEEDGNFHMLITARANHGPPDERGVIAHAVSADLETWKAGPPLVGPGEFGKLEVPQLAWISGAWRLFFCTEADCHGAARLRRPGVIAECGTHYLTGSSRYGPFALDGDSFLLGHPTGRHYAGRVLQHRGAWHLLTWTLYDEQGDFVGELGDPMPVLTGDDGSLAMVRATP